MVKPWMAGALVLLIVLAAAYYLFFANPGRCASTLYADPAPEFVQKCNAAGGSVHSALTIQTINGAKTCMYAPECSVSLTPREELPPLPPGEANPAPTSRATATPAGGETPPPPPG